MATNTTQEEQQDEDQPTLGQPALPKRREQRPRAHDSLLTNQAPSVSPVYDNQSSNLVSSVPKDAHSDHQAAESKETMDSPKSQPPAAPREKSKSGAPAVKLDMDLEVEVELKAKIKGEIELSIL
ncbi:hypothetical protein ACJZ2D_000581 [Fusarium nematophilum]